MSTSVAEFDTLTEQGAYELALQWITYAAHPDPPLWIDEWCEQHMRIPPETGSAEPGPYRVERTPFAREIMRCLSPEHPAQRVVVMGASQLLKTQTFLNACMAWIDGAPANIIALEPSGELTKRLSSRVDKTIKAIPRVAARVALPRARDARNTIGFKDFIGGSIMLATSGTPNSTAEFPARYGFYDEIDRQNTSIARQEGSTVKRFEARFSTFGTRKKIYYVSSPTLEETSVIKQLFEVGDQRRFHVPCPHCGHPHELVLENLVYDGLVARMACPECGGLAEESHKTQMLAAGMWIATSVGDGGETVSFHVSALYMPFGWLSWTAIARAYASAKLMQTQGDDADMQAFYNTRLAIPWSATKGTTSATALMARQKNEDIKPQIVPAGALYVTAAVDTQGDRLEYMAIAWGEGLEHWIIDKRVLIGRPSDEQVWSDLDAIHRDTKYPRADGHGAHAVQALFIDSGGSNTQDVYNFARRRKARHIYAIRGSSRPGSAIIAKQPGKVDIDWRGHFEKKGAEIWSIGTDTAKDWIEARLTNENGPGTVHFCNDLTPDDFEQLTSEYRVGVLRKGRKVIYWHKKKNVRNEGKDLHVYNLAAAMFLGLHKLSTSQWAARRAKVCPARSDPPAAPQPDTFAAIIAPQPAKSAPTAPRPRPPRQFKQPNLAW